MVLPDARYALRKAAAAIGGAPEGLCYDFLQSWPSRGVFLCASRGGTQHTDDGRRSIYTFLPGDSVPFRFDFNSKGRAVLDIGRLRERACAENCRSPAGPGKCVLRNSKQLISAN